METTSKTRPVSAWPTRIARSGSSSSSSIAASGSANNEAASTNETPCFLAFDAAFFRSNVNCAPISVTHFRTSARGAPNAAIWSARGQKRAERPSSNAKIGRPHPRIPGSYVGPTPFGLRHSRPRFKTQRLHKLSACRAYGWLQGQDLNLRPSGYEQPHGTSQPVTATDNPSQSLHDGHAATGGSVPTSPTVTEDFGPPVVRTPMAGPVRIGSLLTVKQVAARLGVSAATVYGLCERRELHHVRVANAIRVSPDALEAFLRTIAAAPPERPRR